MNKGKRENVTIVTIKVAWGSDAQRELHEKVLKQFLNQWQEKVDSGHKNNFPSMEIKEY